MKGVAVGGVSGKRKKKKKERKKERKKRKDSKKYNIKIKSENIDCFRKIPKNTQRQKTSS